jgi:hypothetical protein
MSITAAQKKKFTKLVEGLNDLLDEVRKTEPTANYYLEEDTFHLMKGESHTGTGGDARRDNSSISVHLWHSGGGAW